MVRKLLLGTTLGTASLLTVQAQAAPTYIALGDSITFGETDLQYVQSFGDRGYVGDFASILANRDGGVRPNVVNLAIDGETAASFLNNANPRTPPVVGRTNVPLQLENLNYGNSTVLSQSMLFANKVTSIGASNVSTISLTLGFNELAALTPMDKLTPGAPLTTTEQAAIAQIPPTLASYKTNYTNVLTQVRSLAPNANLYLLGYFNPFPADPTSPAGPIFTAGGTALNNTIQSLAAQFGATYVDNFTPFVGHENQYTYEGILPTGTVIGGQFGGALPIGDVHPNALGYSVIAADVEGANAVPEPSTLALLVSGLGAMGLMLRPPRRSTVPEVT